MSNGDPTEPAAEESLRQTLESIRKGQELIIQALAELIGLIKDKPKPVDPFQKFRGLGMEKIYVEPICKCGEIPMEGPAK